MKATIISANKSESEVINRAAKASDLGTAAALLWNRPHGMQIASLARIGALDIVRYTVRHKNNAMHLEYGATIATITA